jgi:hypothetical protein
MKADYSVHKHILDKLARTWANKWSRLIVATESRSDKLKLIEKAANDRSAIIADIEVSEADMAYYLSECDWNLNLDTLIGSK